MVHQQAIDGENGVFTKSNYAEHTIWFAHNTFEIVDNNYILSTGNSKRMYWDGNKFCDVTLDITNAKVIDKSNLHSEYEKAYNSATSEGYNGTMFFAGHGETYQQIRDKAKK